MTSQVVHTTHPNQARQNIFKSSGYKPENKHLEIDLYYQIDKMNFQFWAILGSQGSKEIIVQWLFPQISDYILVF